MAAGLCWFAAGFLVIVFLYQYLTHGAGQQVLGFLGIGSTSILIGVAHFICFVIAAAVCAMCGIMLCARGLGPNPQEQNEATPSPKSDFASYRHLFTD
jgi:hypothetical protein